MNADRTVFAQSLVHDLPARGRNGRSRRPRHGLRHLWPHPCRQCL